MDFHISTFIPTRKALFLYQKLHFVASILFVHLNLTIGFVIWFMDEQIGANF
jgi:hypothetical protein